MRISSETSLSSSTLPCAELLGGIHGNVFQELFYVSANLKSGQMT